MKRHEIEKKLVEMAEEMLDFYRENVPSGGCLTLIFFNDKKFQIYNDASFDNRFTGTIDVFRNDDVYSLGHEEITGKTIRTKDGEWYL